MSQAGHRKITKEMLHYCKNQNIIANNSKPNNHNKTKAKRKNQSIIANNSSEKFNMENIFCNTGVYF